jgi:hypothetical protein
MLLALGLVGSSCAAPRDEALAAVWTSQELKFNYIGFTSRYSCDGLRDQVEQALITLGARRDLDVTPYGCTTPGGPEPFPSTRIKMSTLKPVPANTQEGTVEAQWKTVNLGGPDKLTPGDCELAEQIRDSILPLFTTRNPKIRLNCVPHQESVGEIQFTVDVLVPAQR